MLTKAFRRLLQSAGLMFSIATIWFLALSAAPGDYFDEARFNTTSPETIAMLRDSYGLSQPLPVRYGRWLRSVLHGDLGVSIAYNMRVSTLIAPRVANTLLLTGTSLVLSWMLALSLGAWAGAQKDGPADRFLRGLAAILLAIPELTAATLLVYWAARTGSLPVGGIASGRTDLPAESALYTSALHMVLPVAVLTAASFPMLFRHVRQAVSDAITEPFIRTAISFGVSPVRLWFQYILPAAANPLLSLFGLSLATLLSSSLVVEVVFGWPGLGPLFLDAVFSRDTYLLLAPVLLSSLFLLAGNLLADFLLMLNDPRIRGRFAL